MISVPQGQSTVSVSHKNRISSVELNGCLCVDVTDIVRRGRLRWFGHLKRKGRDIWVSTCRSFEVAGPKGRGKGRKTRGEHVKREVFEPQGRVGTGQDKVEELIWRESSNLCQHRKTDVKPMLMMMF